MRLTPNSITLLGLPIGITAAFFLSQGSFSFAAFLVLLLGGCDLLDGFLAKSKGLTTPFGAFLDSTIDRITELLLFAGILFFYLRQERVLMVGVTYWVIGASLVISYTRARAENFIQNCRVGFWERPERLGLLLLGLVSGHLNTALWILAFGTTLTALHRIFYTRSTLSQKNPSPFRNILFRDYPRKSWAYRFYVLLVVMLTLSLKLS